MDSRFPTNRQITGGIDLDNSQLSIAPGDFMYSLNYNIGESENGLKDVAENTSKNVKVNYTLPAGTNKCVGVFEDKKNNTVFYLVYNSNNDDLILRYIPAASGTGTIEKILQDDLGFDPDNYINGINLVNNLFYWTDGDNPQRKINIDKSNNTSKRVNFKICFGPPMGVESIIRIQLAKGATTLSANTAIEPTYTTLEQIAEAVYTNWSGSTEFDVVNKGDYLEFTAEAGQEGIWTVTVSTLSGPQYIWYIPMNWYPTVDERVLDVLKWPAWLSPTCVLGYNPDVIANNIRGNTFQFRIKYYYDDYEQSRLGPISEMLYDPTLAGTTDMLNTGNNFISVNYSDGGRLESHRDLVRGVDILMRESNTGAFRTVVSLQQHELSGTYDFYNDGVYSAVGEAESATNYDALPIKSGTQEVVLGRINYGENVEGYESLESLNTEFNTEWADVTSTYDITVYCRIYQVGGAATATTAKFNINQRIPSGKFCVYLAGTPFYNFTEDLGGGVHRAIIPAVPKGKYIIRVASELCTLDPAANVWGNIYNVENEDLSWQKTSTYVRGMATDVGLGDITLGLREKAVTVTTADVTVAEFFAIDSFCDYPVSALLFRGYILDMLDPGIVTVPNTTDIKNDGLNMEFSNVVVGDIDLVIATADHNGFWYLPQVVSVSPAEYYLNAYTYYGQDIKTLAQLTYSGGYSPEDPLLSFLTCSGWPIVNVINPFVDAAAYAHLQNIVPNYNITITEDYRTHVEGYVLNGDGSPIPGVNIVLENTTRYATTDATGFYSLVAYANQEIFGQVVRESHLYVAVMTRYNLDFITSLPISLPIVYPIADNVTPYAVANIIVNINSSFFKHGGTYTFAISYYDRGNRDNFANTYGGMSLVIPWFTQDGNEDYRNFPLVDWAIKHLPPQTGEFTHYQWLRTKNKYTQNYLQFMVAYVDYGTGLTDAGVFVKTLTVSSANKWTFLYLNTLSWYRSEYSNSLLGYTFTKGDRIRFKRDRLNAGLAASDGWYTDVYDYEILSYDAALFQLQIEYDPNFPNLSPGGNFYADVEIYTPFRIPTTDAYFEMSESYELGQTGGVWYHKAGFGGQDQDPADPVGTPATGTFKFGDTYIHSRVYAIDTGANLVADGTHAYADESALLSDNIVQTLAQDNIGRPNAVFINNRQIDRITGMRFSNVYIPTGLANGLSSFEPLNATDLGVSYGRLRRLIYNENVLLAITENKTFSIYINQRVLQSPTGSPVISQTDAYYGSIQDLKGDYGTINPESVVENAGLVKWWDAYRGEVCQYSSNGIDPITPLTVNYFATKGKLGIRAARATYKVMGYYHRQFKRYVLTFQAITVDGTAYPAETFCYNDARNRWMGWMSYLPEAAIPLNLNLITFKNGELWLHTLNATKNNFYGTDYPSAITLSFNDANNVSKVFKSVSVESSHAPVLHTITTPINNTYVSGQLSEILSADFEFMNNGWWASFLQDKNTPNAVSAAEALINGEDLRNNIIVIKQQQLDPNTLFWVKGMTVYAIPDPLTN